MSPERAKGGVSAAKVQLLGNRQYLIVSDFGHSFRPVGAVTRGGGLPARWAGLLPHGPLGLREPLLLRLAFVRQVVQHSLLCASS